MGHIVSNRCQWLPCAAIRVPRAAAAGWPFATASLLCSIAGTVRSFAASLTLLAFVVRLGNIGLSLCHFFSPPNPEIRITRADRFRSVFCIVVVIRRDFISRFLKSCGCIQ